LGDAPVPFVPGIIVRAAMDDHDEGPPLAPDDRRRSKQPVVDREPFRVDRAGLEVADPRGGHDQPIHIRDGFPHTSGEVEDHDLRWRVEGFPNLGEMLPARI
jgi:hypothetical protein